METAYSSENYIGKYLIDRIRFDIFILNIAEKHSKNIYRVTGYCFSVSESIAFKNVNSTIVLDKDTKDIKIITKEEYEEEIKRRLKNCKEVREW